MKINIKHLLFFLLIMAYLNAVLRLSDESIITAFRVLLPIAWIAIYNISRRNFTKMTVITVGVICLSLIQHLLTKYIFFPNVYTLTIAHLIAYLFHAICIITVVYILISLKVLYGKDFEFKFMKFGSCFVKVMTIVYLGYLLLGGIPEKFLLFGNINDLGCIFVVGIGLLLFEEKCVFIYRIAWIAILMILLLYNDSKLAFFGAFIEVGLALILALSSTKHLIAKRFLKILFMLSGVVIIAVILNSSLSINEYSIRGMTIEPIRRVLSGEFYSHSSSSLTFRSNVIIAILSVLRKTYLLGVGIGNTSLILKTLVPDVDLIFSKYIYMASHIWWLELMSDFGLIAFFIMIFVYIRSWRKYLSFNMSRVELFGVLFIISFPIWSMSSSGLYTEYFTISMLAFSVMEIWKLKEINTNNI